jgi:very-short-patch-repair endonuclease
MRRRMFSAANKLLFERASRHRKQQTFTEEILWNYLKVKPFGLKFRRQHPFSIYILDLLPSIETCNRSRWFHS